MSRASGSRTRATSHPVQLVATIVAAVFLLVGLHLGLGIAMVALGLLVARTANRSGNWTPSH